MISLTSNDLKVSTKTKAAQMGNLGFGVGLEILQRKRGRKRGKSIEMCVDAATTARGAWDHCYCVRVIVQ